MLSTWPEEATMPATPCSMEILMLTSPCIANRPRCTLSTRYRVQRSASTTLVVRCVMVKISEFTPISPCIARMISSSDRNLSRADSAWRKRLAFCSAMPACMASISMTSSSMRPKGPVRLLMACSTPTTLLSIVRMGMHRMVVVRYPEALSALLLNLGSEYASTMLIVSPVAATVPAMPWPMGTRMFFAPSAMLSTNSWVTLSRVNIVALSQSRILQDSPMIFSVASSGSRDEITADASKSFCIPSTFRLRFIICSGKLS
mmetsp:Transcript_24732/g.35517  ORF Transcript_24732/g.35517 Transcript_24732/m.35517 type:complete len:260 (-) Transcript_24732:297-1076(-)